jgi:hypothetical protein
MALITASKPRILLADDHPALLAETASLLQRDHEVVGTAGNGLELLAQAERQFVHRPSNYRKARSNYPSETRGII